MITIEIKINDEQTALKSSNTLGKKNLPTLVPKSRMSESFKHLELNKFDEQKVKKFINFEINIIDTGVGIS